MTVAAPEVTVVGGAPRSGEEIQAALTAFAGRWKGYQGTERSEARTFLNELFACYGTDRNAPNLGVHAFPWAGAFATAIQREAVAEACRRLLARRSEICHTEQIGLTTLYNAMDDGAWADLRKLHKALDESVAACYGWPRSVAQDDAEIVLRLTALNREITEGRVAYDPFGAAGSPT